MKKTRLAISLLLVLLLTILTACSGGTSSDRYTLSDDVLSSEKISTYATTKTGFKKNQRIAASGLTELYFDETNFSVAVKDNSTGEWWYSLPTDFVKSADYAPCVLSLDVIYKGQRYYLDSQRDSVAVSTANSEKTENGIIVTYTFNLSLYDGKSAVYTVPVEYSLTDGSLYVSIDCANLCDESNPKDAVLVNINLLNFFGSSVKAKKNDYILVPDNCGGIIHTDRTGKDFENVSLRVYGDLTGNNAMLGAYGMKTGDSAFVSIIEEGDALATVNATAATTSAGYNKVGASFAVTETETVPKNDEKTNVYVPSLSYGGKIKLCYRFLSGSNAGYSGMAIACREQLIRNGVLSSETVESTGDLPFVVSVLGVAAINESGKTQALTTFEQLHDMLTLLKAKGFNNLYVKYRGALAGGLDQAGISGDMSFHRTMGSSQDYRELMDYASAQKIKMFFDVSYLTSPYGSLSKSHLAKGVDGRTSVRSLTNVFGAEINRNMTTLSEIEVNVVELHKLLRNNSIKEVCIADSSDFLYSDYSSGATRNEVRNEIASANLSVSSSAEVMVAKGNLYTLKNASVVSSLPTATSYPETSSYESVPFIQTILHGTLDYSCEPINYTENYKDEILKAIEYGALGEFEWCYDAPDTESSESDETAEASEASKLADKLSYSTWANEVYAYYAKGNMALSDLRGARITDHYQVKAGIYCTEYGDTSIYVNYTNKSFEVQGVTVPANDFMRIN
ncbi:MAG: hypothetical protein IJO24_08420 [Clostridia bacterium]|nr:hypothetical protein [Clostridia bacterium]